MGAETRVEVEIRIGVEIRDRVWVSVWDWDWVRVRRLRVWFGVRVSVRVRARARMSAKVIVCARSASIPLTEASPVRGLLSSGCRETISRELTGDTLLARELTISRELGSPPAFCPLVAGCPEPAGLS